MFIHRTWVFLGVCNAVTLQNVKCVCRFSHQLRKVNWVMWGEQPVTSLLPLLAVLQHSQHYKSWNDEFSLVPSGNWGREYRYKDYLWKDRDPSGTRARGVVFFHGIEELYHWYNGIIYTPLSAEIHLFKDPCFIRAELQPFSTRHNLLLWPATPQTEMGGAQMLL